MSQVDTGVEIRNVSEATPGLESKRMALTEIPVIDISSLRSDDPAAKEAMAVALRRAWA